MPMPGAPAPMPGVPSPPAPPAPPPPPAPRVYAPQHARPAPRSGETLGPHDLVDVPADEERAAHPMIPMWFPRGPANPWVALASGLVTFALVLAALRRLTRGFASVPAASPRVARGAAPYTPTPDVTLRRLSLAYDSSVRAQLQSELAQLAATLDTSTPDGLHAAAQATRDALWRALGAARYGVFQSQGAWRNGAQQAFEAMTDQARGRYTVETVTQARRIAGPRMTARAEEGEGLVVVTLLVASQGAAAPLPTAATRDAMAAALGAMIPPGAQQLMALEVVWSPAEDSDRMSSAELAVLYPELLPLDASPALGRRVCGSCRAVYAAELGRCPACGAPPT